MSIAGVLNNLAEKAAMANPPREGDYIGEDGLLYCGKCRSQKQYRLDGMLAAIIPGGVASGLCKCEAERDKAEKAKERRKQEAIRRAYSVSERRSSCFSDELYHRMSFAADEGKSQKVIEAAHYYADNFDRFLAENKGLMFLGGVGTGKTFAACCIANALIDRGFEASFAGYNIERGAFTIYLSYMLKLKLRDLFSKDSLNKSDSLDRPIGGADDEECDKSPGDFLPDPSAVEAFEHVDDEAERQYISRTMRESIAQLSELEQDIIKRHFYEQQTLRKISEQLGITYAKACTTKNNAAAQYESRSHTW